MKNLKSNFDRHAFMMANWKVVDTYNVVSGDVVVKIVMFTNPELFSNVFEASFSVGEAVIAQYSVPNMNQAVQLVTDGTVKYESPEDVKARLVKEASDNADKFLAEFNELLTRHNVTIDIDSDSVSFYKEGEGGYDKYVRRDGFGNYSLSGDEKYV